MTPLVFLLHLPPSYHSASSLTSFFSPYPVSSLISCHPASSLTSFPHPASCLIFPHLESSFSHFLPSLSPAYFLVCSFVLPLYFLLRLPFLSLLSPSFCIFLIISSLCLFSHFFPSLIFSLSFLHHTPFSLTYPLAPSSPSLCPLFSPTCVSSLTS